MAIEQRSDDAAVEHAGKRFMKGFGLPLTDDLVAARKASYAQTLLVRRAATEAAIVWRIFFLKTLLAHLYSKGVVVNKIIPK